MDRGDLLGAVLSRLAHGEAPRAAQECADLWCRDDEPVAAALASVASFWRGDFAEATRWAGLAEAAAVDDETRALAAAAAALAAAGDATFDGGPSWSRGTDLLLRARAPESRWWSAVRYLLAEAAIVNARLADAARVTASGPPAGDAWADHPFAPMLWACEVRIAAFGGDIVAATALLEPMRASVAPGARMALVIEAVAGLVLGNADDAAGLQRSIDLAAPGDDAAERDFVDRGVLFLLAFGAIALGEVTTAARLVFRAGDDGELGASTIIDRALGFELFLVAALAEEDPAAAQTWLGALEQLADHRVAAPTVQRARARYLLAIGELDGAVADLVASVAVCRAEGRMVEAAEGEIVLARARIAGQDVAAASRELRALVSASDATGHHAVRRSAASALQPVRRRLRPVAGGGWAVLSEREQEVGRMVLEGREIDEIATTLFLSHGTVRTHVSRVLCAFGVPTRIGLLAAVGMTPREELPPPPAPLSPRQAEVARQIATGASNQQIADELGISVKGVEKHVGDVLARWGVRSRFEIARVWWGSAGR